MNYKNTPGPWITIEGDMREYEVTTQARLNDMKVGICEIDTDFDGSIGGEQEANMRLITAAPDLLNALASIVEMNPELPMGMIEAAQAAVEKATGERTA